MKPYVSESCGLSQLDQFIFEDVRLKCTVANFHRHPAGRERKDTHVAKIVAYAAPDTLNLRAIDYGINTENGQPE
jgi:hypothetical protein